MSKEHFIALADQMKDWLATNSAREMDDIDRGIVLDHVARFCESQNPRFNRNRWYGYIEGKCGPNGGAR